MNIFKKFLTCGLYFSVCIFVYKTFCYFSKYICIHSESLDMPYLLWGKHINSFFDMFLHSDHCWYIYSFVFSFIELIMPKILNMHPQEAIIISSKLILFPIFLVLLWIISNNLFKYCKNINPVLRGGGVLLSCYIIIYALYSVGANWFFYSCCWFLSYLFLPIFGVTLYNISEYCYVSQEKLSKKTITAIIILMLCIAVSHEYFKFMFLVIAPLVYFLHLLLFRKFPSLKTFAKHLTLYSFIVFMFLLNNFSQEYRYWWDAHIQKDLSFNLSKDYISTFCAAYQKFVLSENLFYFLTFFLFVVIILLAVKDKEKNTRFLIFTSSTIIAALLFFVGGFFASQHYDYYVNWVLPEHLGLRCLLKITLITVIFSSFGYLMQYIKKSITKQIIAFIIFSLLCIFLFWQNFYLDFFNFEKNMKINAYIIEKAFIINKKTKNNKIFYTYNNDNYLVYNIAVYKSDYKYEDFEIIPACKMGDNWTICRENMLKMIEKEFGYKFTEKELKELDFNSLFILNESSELSLPLQ